MLSAGYPAEVFASVCCLCCAVCRVCFSVLSHAVKPVLAPSQFEALSHTPYTYPIPHPISLHGTSLFLAKRLIVTDKRVRD